MKDKDINFLIVGVGGQGTILASDVISEAGMLYGYDVKKTDVLGLAIRGGSVNSHIRWSSRVNAPMIMKGQVDYLLAFEPLEALRQIEYLHEKSIAIFNEYKIPPVMVSIGLSECPKDETIKEVLLNSTSWVYSIDATAHSVKLGNVKTMNVLLLGALTVFLDIEIDIWEKSIEKFIPKKVKDINLQAFYTGRKLLEEAIRGKKRKL